MNGESDNSTLVSGVCCSRRVRRESAFVTSWRLRAERLRSEVRVFYFAVKHPRMPWLARFVAACTVGYVLSPIQLIPNFIPVIGFADDLVVLLLGIKLLRRMTPSDVLTECRKLAETAEMHAERKSGPRPCSLPR